MKTTKQDNEIWDVVVIGGGSSGMMAAGRAAERGRSVLLLEKNPILGKKLLITGGGRCNVTNNQPTIHSLAAKYKKQGPFLFSAFSQFGVADTLEFFNTRGLPTKEENDGRMFPVSNSAQSVWQVLVDYMKQGKVTVRTNAAVTSITRVRSNMAITLKDKTTVVTKSCIIATGGASHTETGSTGEAFRWLKKFGHTIVPNDFALVPLALRDPWVKKLAGLTLKDIKITIFKDDKKHDSKKGNLLFTHVGVSGPTILNLSREIGELLPYHAVKIVLDLFPARDHSLVKQELQSLLITNSNRKIKNTLNQIIPASLVPILLEIAKIDGETPNHSVRHDDRITIVTLFKALPLKVKGLLGSDKAVVSSGGVVLTEVDFKTMRSRVAPELFIIGDMLNIDRPSGGYSLQLCWTTGFVAGSNA